LSEALARAEPPAASVFAPVHDRYGPRLALVFGNHAPGGICPYYAAARCHHCDIGAGEGAAFDPETNRARLAWFRDRYAALLPDVAHLVIYNSGSVLNPREMPPNLLDEILAFARALPATRVVSLDSREPYITAPALERVARALGPAISGRPILGLESADDAIRDGLLEKRMPRPAIRRAFAAAGAAGLAMDVNIVIGSPGTTPETAPADAAATARYAFDAGREAGVAVDLNLHPYYPSARGLTRFPGHARCSLATTARAVRAIDAVRCSLAPAASLFIGWQDEGHDREPAARAAELARALAAIDTFNRTQDAAALAALEPL
jgi:hypothetical protein